HRQARSQRVERCLHRVGAVVLTQEHGRLISLQDERLGARGVLLPGSVETLNSGARMPTTDPLGLGPERASGQCRVLLDRFDGPHQLIDVNAIDSAHDLLRHDGFSCINSVAFSAPFTGLRARNVMPNVPKSAALVCCGAPAKTSACQVISKSTKPAATTVACSSASSRAPAIQPVHRSIRCLAVSGTARCTRISATCRRPPGLSTRAISLSVAALSGVRFSAPLEIT